MESYDIEYNGRTASSFGVLLQDYPDIAQAKKNYTLNDVPGMDGGLITDEGYRSPITITCTFAVLSEQFMLSVREIKRWLTGPGRLVLSESRDFFYEVKQIENDSLERDMRKLGRFTVSFLCYPYEFLKDAARETSIIPTYNAYDLCKPVYKITGEGKCVLSVNYKNMTANVGQNLTIDTRRKMSYREDQTEQNTSVTGDYEDLWLPPGQLEVTITNGFALSIITNWGYYA